jgi:hypothetical protein
MADCRLYRSVEGLQYGAMRVVILAWLFFVLMGLFIGLVVPLGEGFDEPWHLGYIQYLAQTGTLPPGPRLHLSVELETFLRLHPVGWRLKGIYPGLHSQEDYWHAPEAERALADQTLRSLRFESIYREGEADFSPQYESHQAPLYYLLMAPLFLGASKFLSFLDTFLFLRLASLLLASAVVPLTFALAKRVSASHMTPMGATMMVALFPGIYPDVVRVSNDALAVPLAAATFVMLARYLDWDSRKNRLLLGLTLLAGLCTKAFFVPIVAAIVAWMIANRRFRTAAIISAISVPGWIWYLRNLFVTGSVTGLPETVAASTTVMSSITSLAAIGWKALLRLTAVSHIWIGNWSLLQYRSWIYQTIMVLFAAGVAGFLAFLFKSSSRILQVLMLIYVAFAASLVYYATQVLQQIGVPVIQGWYLSLMIPIEAIVFAVGIEFLFRRRFGVGITAFTGVCFLAMLIYGNAFIAAPYYAGLTEHAASGHLRAYHPQWADISVLAARLVRFHPWIPGPALTAAAVGILATGFLLIWQYCESSR